MTFGQILMILLAIGFIFCVVVANKERKYDELKKKMKREGQLTGKDARAYLKRKGTREDMIEYERNMRIAQSLLDEDRRIEDDFYDECIRRKLK